MPIPFRRTSSVIAAVALPLLMACGADPTTPTTSHRLTAAFPAAHTEASTSLPSGEHDVGQSSIEPAYDDVTGTLTFLLTPLNSPFPTHTSTHAEAPLYIVEYPPGNTVGTLNCMGVPGNCPDHDGIVAGVATQIMPSVYGTNAAAVPGHDHLVATPASGGDFNVAWHVYEVLFTSKTAANTHLTTKSALDAAVAAGKAIIVDLGFAFHCSVVPSTVYWNGTPVG
jgi:hypothetical protein